MHALIIEDDTAIAEFIARGLREAGFAVDVAADGKEGLEAALTGEPDVAIVDLMLPGRDGLSVIDELRRQGRSTPVLILSARRSVDDRVRGLQAGGDDYLTKPLAFAELLARVQALVRRATRTPEATTLTVGETVGEAYVETVTRPTFKDPYTHELEYFHEMVTTGSAPKTTPEDFAGDLDLFQEIMRVLIAADA